MGLTYVVVLYVANLYDHYQDFRRRENISQIILSSLIGTLVVIIAFTLPARHLTGRSFVEWQGVVFVWLLVLWRYGFSAIALPLRLQRKVLIVGGGGAGAIGSNLTRALGELGRSWSWCWTTCPPRPGGTCRPWLT